MIYVLIYAREVTRVDLGALLRERRLQLGLTLQQVGDAVGVGRSTVRKWEQGMIKNMRRDKIGKLAAILMLNESVFTKYEGGAAREANMKPVSKKRVPMLGVIAAGQPIYADEEHESYVLADEDLRVDFALRVQGDSMDGAEIHDGDIVFVRQQDDVDDGQIAAVLIDDSATLKRLYHARDRVTLVAENPKYAPMVFSQDETVRVLGLAVYCMSRIK